MRSLPEIIEKTGKRYRTSEVSGEELIRGLEAKLLEEFNEFIGERAGT